MKALVISISLVVCLWLLGWIRNASGQGANYVCPAVGENCAGATNPCVQQNGTCAGNAYQAYGIQGFTVWYCELAPEKECENDTIYTCDKVKYYSTYMNQMCANLIPACTYSDIVMGCDP